MTDESYTEANSGGVIREGSGYFSSSIPTITSESATHLPSKRTTGTFPSGFTPKNLTITKNKIDITVRSEEEETHNGTLKFNNNIPFGFVTEIDEVEFVRNFLLLQS